jgi:hypothetical protein
MRLVAADGAWACLQDYFRLPHAQADGGLRSNDRRTCLGWPARMQEEAVAMLRRGQMRAPARVGLQPHTHMFRMVWSMPGPAVAWREAVGTLYSWRRVASWRPPVGRRGARGTAAGGARLSGGGAVARRAAARRRGRDVRADGLNRHGPGVPPRRHACRGCGQAQQFQRLTHPARPRNWACGVCGCGRVAGCSEGARGTAGTSGAQAPRHRPRLGHQKVATAGRGFIK